MLQTSFDTTAAAYDRRIGRWSRLYTPSLVAAARICPGDCVLDVATGTGEAAIAAAAIAGSGGRVVASDISLPMLSAARSKAGGILVAAMDALALACRDESVDAVICQLGLMLFPDAARGLREFRRVLRDGRWMAACVWSVPERAPFIGIFDDVMGRHVPDKREEIMASTPLGDWRRLHDLVAAAGFREVSVTPETQPRSRPSRNTGSRSPQAAPRPQSSTGILRRPRRRLSERKCGRECNPTFSASVLSSRPRRC